MDHSKIKRTEVLVEWHVLQVLNDAFLEQKLVSYIINAEEEG